jgi:hypothetical protein
VTSEMVPWNLDTPQTHAKCLAKDLDIWLYKMGSVVAVM